MTSKLLKRLLYALIFALPSISIGCENCGVWTDSPTGKCFDSDEEFFEKTYGPGFREDENIRTLPIDSGLQYLWAIDATPQVNVTRTLLRREGGKRTCAIAYIPLSSTVSLGSIANNELPKEIISLDTPPPGFAGHKVIYRLDSTEGVYHPSECFRMVASSVPERVPCADLYD
jgi:hypothetical protein